MKVACFFYQTNNNSQLWECLCYNTEGQNANKLAKCDNYLQLLYVTIIMKWVEENAICLAILLKVKYKLRAF